MRLQSPSEGCFNGSQSSGDTEMSVGLNSLVDILISLLIVMIYYDLHVNMQDSGSMDRQLALNIH
jgi:hypothetical protein